MISTTKTQESSLQRGLQTLSTGAKLMLVGLLALLMSLGALFISSTVDERQSRAGDVLRDVSGHVGGSQTFLGPTLLVPYTQVAETPALGAKHGVYVVFPATATATVKTDVEERKRSLFKVPVFRADAQMQASFDLTSMAAALPQGMTLDWKNAEIVVGASDARGALADATLTGSEGTSVMAPATTVSSLFFGKDNNRQTLSLFGAKPEQTLQPGTKFNVTAKLRFSGAERLAVLPYGKSTQVEISSDWASPGFDGGFLPSTRDVSSKGFHATWSIPFIARGVRAEGDAESITGLETAGMGVSFIEPADPYQSVNRSLKYAPLFLGLVFLTYFMFEVTTGLRLHIAQYLLVGLAQLIFYLLLLSFAERIGFDLGFLLGGGATVALLATNVAWVFRNRMQAARAGAVFGGLYGMIYLLLRLEDNALLLGAIGSFAAVAAAMYFTRRVDWYGSDAPRTPMAGGSGTGFGAPVAFRVGEL